MFKRITSKDHSKTTAENNNSGPDLIKIVNDDEGRRKPPYQQGVLDYRAVDWWDSNYTPPDYHTREEFDLIFPKKDD